MARCEICKKDGIPHVNHEQNLEFGFCERCKPWLRQSYFDSPTQIIKNTSAQKLLKDHKTFREFWRKVYHKVYQFNSGQIDDILLARTSSEFELDFYESKLEQLDKSGRVLYHDKTTLKGHTVFWSLVLK